MRKILFIFMSVCLSMHMMAQTDGKPQTIIIERLTGVEMRCAIEKVGRLTFANDSIYLVAHNGDILGKEAQAQTRKIIFDSAERTTTLQVVSDFSVYPNPTSDYLTISGLQDGTTIRIYGQDGRLWGATATKNSTVVLPISHLPQGTYLLQINTSIVKFIKK